MNKKNSFIEKMIDGFLRDGYKSLVFLAITFLVLTYPLPYYIFTSGGITDLAERFNIENGYNQKGSYNLSYVSQVNGNVATCLASYLFPDWKLVEIDNYQVNSNETIEEMSIRDHLDLRHANQTATMLAYKKAGKNVIEHDVKLYTYAVFDMLESDKKIKIGDILLEVDNKALTSVLEIRELLKNKNPGDLVNFKFQRDDYIYETLIKVQEVEGAKIVGIQFYQIYDYEVEPKISFNFKASESGSSAGLMTTLAIYDTLIEEDLTNGLKIAGTGTIDSEGNVGEIGAVTYKLAGAEKGGADIFFAPSGSNYEEAMKAKKDRGYDIEVVEVKTFDDAVNYLKNRKLEKE